MKTYWDHTEPERAALSEDQVQNLMDMHLMERGVLKVIKGPLTEIKPVPEMPTRPVFVVLGLGFDSIESAKTLLELSPFKADYDYHMGAKWRYAKPYSDYERTITREMVYERADLVNLEGLLKANTEAEKANANVEEAFSKANAKVADCTDEVWHDWHIQCAADRKHRQLVATWNEYLGMTQGDRVTASKFLWKIFSLEAIKEATKWTGEPILESEAVPA